VVGRRWTQPEESGRLCFCLSALLHKGKGSLLAHRLGCSHSSPWLDFMEQLSKQSPMMWNCAHIFSFAPQLGRLCGRIDTKFSFQVLPGSNLNSSGCNVFFTVLPLPLPSLLLRLICPPFFPPLFSFPPPDSFSLISVAAEVVPCCILNIAGRVRLKVPLTTPLTRSSKSRTLLLTWLLEMCAKFAHFEPALNLLVDHEEDFGNKETIGGNLVAEAFLVAA
jgi:hypothetical protein